MKKVRIKPYANRVIVKMDPEQEPGEFIVAPTEDLRDFASLGTVLSCGSRCSELKPGDRVLVNRFAPRRELGVRDGKALIIIRETELGLYEAITIVGIVED